MRTASLISALGIVSFAALAGCSSETLDSDLVKTKGIAITVDVSATNDGASNVHVLLQAGGDESNTYIELQSGDSLSASADGNDKGMEHTGEGEYEADFGTGEGGVVYVVDFQRADDTSAPNSRGVMPEPFTVTPPEDGLKRAEDPLTIEWGAGSDGEMHIVVEGSCIFQYDEDVPDNGSYTIAAGKLDSTGQDMPESCDLKATLTRTAYGTPDAAYDSESEVALRQIRSASFTSDP